eukprot:364868-Chlamydomonas_euryale.AAC.4
MLTHPTVQPKDVNGGNLSGRVAERHESAAEAQAAAERAMRPCPTPSDFSAQSEFFKLATGWRQALSRCGARPVKVGAEMHKYGAPSVKECRKRQQHMQWWQQGGSHVCACVECALDRQPGRSC